jgi:hypothetical protein
MHRVLGLALFLLAASGPTVSYADANMDRVFKELEPEERAHQACNLRGIDAVRKVAHLKGVDRITPSIFNPAKFKDNIVTAKGGAVRAHDHWYHLDFTCAVTADQMKATSFDFKLGEEIPQDKWEDFGLWK